MGALKRSIREFGFVSPVVVRKEDNLILGGHQRVEAQRRIAEEDGIDPATIKIPVAYVAGLTEEKSKLLNVSLNKISGDWDYDRLSDLFGSMSDLGAEALTVTGFDDREIADIASLIGEVGDLALPDVDDVDAVIANGKRRIVVDLDTDADRDFVITTLKAYGAQGERVLGPALLTALRALPPKAGVS